MARLQFAGSSADFTMNSDGSIAPNETVSVWDSRSGGSQVTDLLDMDNNPITHVTSDSLGLVAFQGPDEFDGVLWLEGAGDRLAASVVDPVTRAKQVITPGGGGIGYAYYNGTTWPARPVVQAGAMVVWVSTAYPAAPPSPNAEDFDGWWRSPGASL